MFVFEPDEPVPSAELLRTADRLRDLAHDFVDFARGEWPTSADLSNAPLIEGYAPYLVAVPSLIGLVTGHATLPGSGRRIATSQLWAVHKDRGWARTLNRFYRLGNPYGQSQAPESLS